MFKFLNLIPASFPRSQFIFEDLSSLFTLALDWGKVIPGYERLKIYLIELKRGFKISRFEE